MARASTSHVIVRLTSLVLLLGFGSLLWGCSAVVKFKDPPNQCGDGVRDPWESCDGTDLGDGTCQQQGYPGGTLSCDNECQYILDLCGDTTCGDGRWEIPEECDGLEIGFDTCLDHGFQSGLLQCNGDCTYNTDLCTNAPCGDSFCDLENGESSLGCPEDCNAHCGNHICELGRGETTAGCEADCAWQEISAGSQFTCATRKDNSLWCWGANDHGKLGDNTGVDSSWPVKVGLLGVGRVSAGRDHVCALQSGNTFCWGLGTQGQLGYGNWVDRYEPEPLAHVADWLAAGGDASCSVQSDGVISCWGANSAGQLGIGDEDPGDCGPVICADMPMPISGMATGEAVTVAPADDGETHVCALQAGAAWCWGRDNLHQTGRALSTGDGTTPEPVDGWSSSPPNLMFIAAGQGFTCASDNMATWCWGDNASAQLGNGSSNPAATWIPQSVMGISGTIMSLSAGQGHTCVHNSEGSAWCWGGNSSGQIGDGSMDNRNWATPPTGLPGPVVNISAGATHTCAVVSIAEPYHHRIYCWGANDRGQLGDGTLGQSLVPVEVIDPPAPPP